MTHLPRLLLARSDVGRKLVIGLASLALSACESGQLPTESGEPARSRVSVSSQQVVALAQKIASLNTGDPIPGHYIVRFEDDVTDASGLATAIAAVYGSTATFVYTSAINGFAAHLPESAVDAISRHPRVLYVEQDGVVSATETQTNPTWGLDRIDQRNLLPDDDSYTYDNDGAGVDAYVLDTGIRTTHEEFGGRATFEIDFIGDGRHMENNGDCQGHGTHVAGTLGSATYGVAKAVDLHAVRVLGCTGGGSRSGVIAGVDWVTANFVGPAVANMSLGGSFGQTLNDAVTNSIAAGVTYAVAAMNNNADACTRSAASTPDALTVGATNATDDRANFSNFGTCLDLFAPGVNITSTTNLSNVSTGEKSGTSMAAPHVAGVAALYLADDPTRTPAIVMAAILANATAGVVDNIEGTESPNLLLYSRLNGTGPALVAPMNLMATATAGSASQIDLAWDDIADETLYEIQRQESGGTFAVVAIIALDITAYSDGGLVPNTTYGYRVRGINGGGPGPYSAIATAPTPDPIDVHVASIAVSKTKSGRNTTGFANVTIHDASNGPANAATVTGDWLINGGSRVTGTQGVTDSNGMTTISSGRMADVKGKDVIEFCVTDVTGAGLLYDSGSNGETCDVVGGGDPEPPPEGFTLTAKVTRRTRVELKWTGSSAISFDVYRDGLILVTDTASPYVEQPGSGTWTYTVCEAGATSTCTNDATVTVK